MIKITIITVCLNSANTIISTLESISCQSYSNIEHIIIDGGSTDGTIQLIRSWSSHKIKLFINNNLGIYESMNLGIRLASGDVIGMLNSDDLLIDKNVLSDIASIFYFNNPDSVIGDIVYVDSVDLNLIVRDWVSGPYHNAAFKKGWQPAHPTFYLRRDLYNKYGGYDPKFKSAADFELMLRFYEKHNISSEYLPRVLVKMRVGGVSNKSYINIFIANFYNLLAFHKNNISVNYILYPFYRLAPKFFNLIYNKIRNR